MHVTRQCLRNMSAASDNEAVEEVRQVLASIQTEDCKSLAETKLIHSLGVDVNTGVISIKLNLTKDYRKGKAII